MSRFSFLQVKPLESAISCVLLIECVCVCVEMVAFYQTGQSWHVRQHYSRLTPQVAMWSYRVDMTR